MWSVLKMESIWWVLQVNILYNADIIEPMLNSDGPPYSNGNFRWNFGGRKHAELQQHQCKHWRVRGNMIFWVAFANTLCYWQAQDMKISMSIFFFLNFCIFFRPKDKVRLKYQMLGRKLHRKAGIPRILNCQKEIVQQKLAPLCCYPYRLLRWLPVSVGDFFLSSSSSLLL